MSTQQEYAAPISDKVYAKLEAAIQHNESLLIETLRLQPLKVETVHYILPEDIISLPLPPYFQEKFPFTFFDKKIQNIITTARGQG